MSSDQDCLSENELESERMKSSLPGPLANCSSHNDVSGAVKASFLVPYTWKTCRINITSTILAKF